MSYPLFICIRKTTRKVFEKYHDNTVYKDMPWLVRYVNPL